MQDWNCQWFVIWKKMRLNLLIEYHPQVFRCVGVICCWCDDKASRQDACVMILFGLEMIIVECTLTLN